MNSVSPFPGRDRREYPDGRHTIAILSLVLAVVGLHYLSAPDELAATPVGQELNPWWREAYAALIVAGGLGTAVGVWVKLRLLELFSCSLIVAGALVQVGALVQLASAVPDPGWSIGAWVGIALAFAVRVYRLRAWVITRGGRRS